MAPVNQLKRRVSAAIFDSDLIATRVALGVAEALWAIILWWPGETFRRDIYGAMAQVMHEDAWGLVFALLAVTQLTIVAMEHFNVSYARYFSGGDFVVWAFVCESIVLAEHPPSGVLAGNLTLMLAAGWVWLRPALLWHWYRKARRDVE